MWQAGYAGFSGVRNCARFPENPELESCAGYAGFPRVRICSARHRAGTLPRLPAPVFSAPIVGAGPGRTPGVLAGFPPRVSCGRAVVFCAPRWASLPRGIATCAPLGLVGRPGGLPGIRKDPFLLPAFPLCPTRSTPSRILAPVFSARILRAALSSLHLALRVDNSCLICSQTLIHHNYSTPTPFSTPLYQHFLNTPPRFST